MKKPKVAIINYHMSNLASVQNALTYCSIDSTITSDREQILESDAAILPGVGAFGDAIRAIKKLGLSTTIKNFIDTGKPFIGICLGMQLLMGESQEFGNHEGLNMISGKVVRLVNPKEGDHTLKIPHVSWNRIYQNKTDTSSWKGTLLQGLPNGFFMYFVHSFHVIPASSGVQIAMTKYGELEFCSVLKYKNITAFQGHPERSGPQGLTIYKNLYTQIMGNN